MADRARDHDDIEFAWNTELLALDGSPEEGITGATPVSHPDGYPEEKYEAGDDVAIEEADVMGPDDNDDWWAADSQWPQENMAEYTCRRYRRLAHAGPISVGDEWKEFVNCGYAIPEDAILRVERVFGGFATGSETSVEVVSRRSLVETEVGSDDVIC